MQKLNGKIANLFACGGVIGSAPLLLVCITVSDYVMAKKAGQPFDGDAIGLVMLAGLAFVIAIASFFMAAIYLCYMWVFRKLIPRWWQLIALAWMAMVICTPMIYLATAEYDGHRSEAELSRIINLC